MTTKYTYSEGTTYQSESTPITVGKIPTGKYKIKAVSGDLKGEFSYIAGPGTQEITVTARAPLVYGFRIAVNNSDPSARVTYPETIHGMKNLCYGFTPASGTGADCMNDWDGCPLISGIHRQLGNSTDGWVDISNTAAWQAGSSINDMMTYIPTWYMKMTNDGTYIDCAFSEKQIDDTWKDYAGSVGTNRVGHFRVGCFAGYVSSSNLYSRGSVTPTATTSLTNFITYAKNRGTGYDIMTWYQWTYLVALATLLYKSTNLQSAMARGYVESSSVQTESSLTWNNKYGMAGGTTIEQMSFFWIQNLWGNMYQYIGGAMTDSSGHLLCKSDYSSVTESEFDISTEVGSDMSRNYISEVSGTTITGFFPTKVSGSSSTYFADRGCTFKSRIPYVGGDYDDYLGAGPFSVYFYLGAPAQYSNIGSRLSYRL